MKLRPAAIMASSTLNDAASSAVHPNTLPPRHRGATCKRERPRVRSCMDNSDLIGQRDDHGTLSLAVAFLALDAQRELGADRALEFLAQIIQGHTLRALAVHVHDLIAGLKPARGGGACGG